MSVECRLCREPAVGRVIHPFGSHVLCEGHLGEVAAAGAVAKDGVWIGPTANYRDPGEDRLVLAALYVSARYGPHRDAAFEGES
jgi:hypothetical protein